MYRWARSIWRSRWIPGSLRKKASPLVNATLNQIAPLTVRLARHGATPKPGPLLVSGLLSSSKGIGRAGRLTIAALRSAGLNPATHDLTPLLDESAPHASELPGQDNTGVWILHCNAPEAMYALTHLDPGTWRHRYRIGYWAWELPKAPSEWKRAASFFHEIWTPSTFTQQAFAGVKPLVRVMPHAVNLEPELPDQIVKNDDCVTCLAMGDLRSSLWRKNLFGAVSAYCKAMPNPHDGVRLVVKIQSDHTSNAGRLELENNCAGRPDIVIIDKRLGDREVLELIASADIFISLHRAEGFGLTLAEAMHWSIPVVATGWSGNVDFMRSVPELLVPYTMTHAHDPASVYRVKGADWADPDLDSAATIVRQLIDNPHMRAELGRKARTAVQDLGEEWAPDVLQAMNWSRYLTRNVPAQSVNGSIFS